MAESESKETGPQETLPPGLGKPLDLFLTAMERERGLSFNTLEAYRRDLFRYLQGLARQGVHDAGEVRPQHVAELLHHLREAGLSPSTLARNLTSIKRFHGYLLGRGMCRDDPAANLDPPKLDRKPPGFLSVGEIDQLMQAADSAEPLGLRDRAILELLYATGMRVSELIALVNSSLLLDDRLLCIEGKSTGKRFVPIGRQAVFFTRNYIRDVRPQLVRPHSGEIVFLNAQGGGLSRMGIWKIIRGAASRARMEKEISPHTLRHSFASHMLEGGANLREVQELLGHADISSTQVYARLDHKDLREVHRTYHPRG